MTRQAAFRSRFDELFDTSLDEVLSRHEQSSPAEAALSLFHTVARTVPAYARFLSSHGVDPARIVTPADLERVPMMTKAEYFAGNPLADVCRGGKLEQCDMIAVSSGSTGTPTFWPRFVTDELPVVRRFEQAFRDSFRAHERRTLAVVCFPMGTWVGGLYTTSCCRHLATKGYPITVVAPGNNKAEIMRVLSALGGSFEQRVLLGYPPFLKDVIDGARAEGFDWGAVPTKLVLAGEVISEPWRTLVAERLGGANPLVDFVSLYGTADAGVLGNETALSISIRRFLAERPEAAREIFGESRMPTLVQYDPMHRFFEVWERTLLFTGDNGVPLVRYHIADTGGVYGFDELMARVRALGFFEDEAASAAPVRRLPFVYVFGRADFTVSYFGANVFPENITLGLEQPDIREWVTGKFVLETREDGDRDEVLHVTVELAPEAYGSEERAYEVARSIHDELGRVNSEFASYVPPAKQLPRVELRPHGDPDYFPVGVKHRYSRKG